MEFKILSFINDLIFSIKKKKENNINNKEKTTEKVNIQEIVNKEVSEEYIPKTKEAILFNTGGIRPTRELGESWIGACNWYDKEEIPVDNNNEPMEPLVSIFLKDLKGVPKVLKGIEYIVVFVPKGVFIYNNNFNIVVKTFKDISNLERVNYKSSLIKSFPLIVSKTDNEVSARDWADDYGECYGGHKIGGYPLYIQDDPEFDDEFVMQISSDEKAGLNIVDGGRIYFYYNKEKDNWTFYYDFY